MLNLQSATILLYVSRVSAERYFPGQRRAPITLDTSNLPELDVLGKSERYSSRPMENTRESAPIWETEIN
jgi:hypothetical protein